MVLTWWSIKKTCKVCEYGCKLLYRLWKKVIRNRLNAARFDGPVDGPNGYLDNSEIEGSNQRIRKSFQLDREVLN